MCVCVCVHTKRYIYTCMCGCGVHVGMCGVNSLCVWGVGGLSSGWWHGGNIHVLTHVHKCTAVHIVSPES